MDYSGPLKRDTTWEGVVQVGGDVVVPEGMTLRLRPGTIVGFAQRPAWSCAVFRSAPEGHAVEVTRRESCDLVVLGRLEVLGTQEKPVLLGDGGAIWGGLSCLGRGTAVVQGAVLRRAHETLLQSFDDSRILLRECRLQEAPVGLWTFGLSKAAVEGGSIAASRCAVLSCEGSSVDLRRTSLAGSPQGCSAHDWSLLRIEQGRFGGHREHAVLALQRSWVRLLDCSMGDAESQISRHHQARLDALR